MKRSIEDIIKLVAVKQAAPPPTRLEKPSTVKEDPTRPMATLCGITYPAEYDNGIAVGHYDVREVYRDIIPWMYCRPLPEGGCEPLYPSEPIDSMPSQQTVTDRDLPLTWQREHPEFNPNDPATWGSVFGPGGFVDRMIRYANCPRDENYQPIPCHSEETIREFIDIVRQFYAVRCGFVASQTGACCSPDGEFGGFRCDSTTSTGCVGNFYPGKSCADINGNNCGLAPNPLQQSNQVKRPKEAIDMVMSSLKRS